MKTQQYLVNYILVHIIPVCDWAAYTYQQKKQFHYIVTVSGKVIPLKPLAHDEGTIEVVYVGSELYATDSAALFGLLIDLWLKHHHAKIMYAKNLHGTAFPKVFIHVARWLLQHMPVWLQRRLPKYGNLFTLRSLLPVILN